MPATYIGGGAQESMGMALAETHSSGDTEPDCSIPRKNSSGGIRTPTNKQNFKPKICPLYKKYNDKEGPRTERMANNNQPKLRHGQTPIPNTINDTLLCLQSRI